ncbi:unnamed protein product [Rotaria magnacalcarata]|uniref:PNPLA domain-containing protein n=2 Tax=Rotaria magnacalcarata TaxID=392030 RepID=A0A816EJH9_9BILA|nr:unnamed protein product [Rotaria magnacalcarata]CAF1966789.1 unnamed protein product [Rotaria magnacalcarata]
MDNADDLNLSIQQGFEFLLTLLANGEAEKTLIESQFSQIYEMIGDLENISYSYYVNHRYRYHKLHAAYFQKIRDDKKEKREEGLLRKYEALKQLHPIAESSIQTDRICSQEANYDSDISWEAVQDLVTSISNLEDTNQIASTIKDIRHIIILIFQHPIRTIDEYIILQSKSNEILSLFEALKMTELDDILLNEDTDQNSNYIDLLNDFIGFIHKSLEERQIYFVETLLSDLPRLNKILFDDIPQTEQSITRRYREWARIFHSDKHGANPKFDELMKHINYIRDNHLSRIYSLCAKSDVVQNELEEGHKHAKLSMDFKKRFSEGGDEELNVEELKKLFSFEALRAFEHYRAALKSLGRMDQNGVDIMQRAQILEWMALMMRLSGNHDVEAQLYFVAAIYIITSSTMTEEMYQKLRTLQSALEKYQGLSTSNVEEKNSTVSTNANRELVLCTNPKLSSREIHDETQVFIRETILRKCVVRCSKPQSLSVENNLRKDVTFKTSVNSYIIVGSGTAGLMGLVIPSLFASWMLNKLIFRKNKTKSLESLSVQYSIRSKLNEIMSKAVDCYNSEMYGKFIQCLSMSYYQDQQLMDTVIGSDTISIEIRVDQLIHPLLEHGFRADKIAHLLILIGEVLLRGVDFGDPNRKNPSHSALLEQSKILFRGVYDSSKLIEAAKRLDSRVEKYHHNRIKKITNKIINSISEQDIKDSRETPFSYRLTDSQRLARLNYAIACLLAGGKDNLEQCKQSLTQLKLSENNGHDRFFVIPDERIQALEDLLSAFGMADDNFNFPSPVNITAICSNTVFDVNNIQCLKTHLGYQACQAVKKLNEEDDQLTTIAQIVHREHNFDCEIFIQFVLDKYSNTNEHILELLRHERVSTLREWAEKFRSNRKIFLYHGYLPLISTFGNIKIQPCDIASDVEYGLVYVPSRTLIDYTLGKDEPHNLFLVIRPGEDRIHSLFTVVPIEISHLHWQLKEFPQDYPERAKILLRIAEYYIEEARQNDKRNHLSALCCWQKAQNYYADILSMKETAAKQDLDLAETGYCKCLLKQHRYSRINERLSARDRISSADLWLIYAQAQRNIGDYDAAKYGIQKALGLHSLDTDIKREEKAIKMKSERIKVIERLDFNCRSSSLDERQPWYNILSIDGGGIRGIIPAIWLMELERKIRQPISSIFNIVAGTSTGAIIAAGLTTPSLDNKTMPRYQAFDLVELYRSKASRVFSGDQSTIGRLRTSFLKEPKYMDTGRQALFQEYFGDATLSDSMSELVIPAVKNEGNVTDQFTRRASKQDPTNNFRLTDVLMCTTAAPTYFPAYRFNNTVYVDGGVQANNPAMIAYDHTLNSYRNCDRNRIRILSLGTGDFVSDPLNPEANRNLLFWARNHQSVFKILMDGPQNNIDLHLNSVLSDNYYRWQIWLENPIELDDKQDTTIDRLIDLAHGHLEEMEAYDNRHRLGCVIENLRSK